MVNKLGITDDLLGTGLQVGGALYSDWQDDKRRREDQDRADELAQQKRLAEGRNRLDMLRQNAEDNQARTRGMNMKGLDFLSGQVNDATALGRQIPMGGGAQPLTFRDALAVTGGLR